MYVVKEKYVWAPESLLEVELKLADDFLKIRETLTRIGVTSKKDNTLFQSCHILHKRGRYFIVSFKELFLLDGRPSDISKEDVARRNTIAALLEQWGLCSVKTTQEYETLRSPQGSVKVVPHREKSQWKLEPKYSMRSDRTKK
jgi:hypothetical protein